MENYTALNYKDICLIPNKCVVKSRSECSTKIDFLGKSFVLPVLPSNMLSTINEDVAKQLSFGGYFYIFHTFRTQEIKKNKILFNILGCHRFVLESSYYLISSTKLSACKLSKIYSFKRIFSHYSNRNNIKFIPRL